MVSSAKANSAAQLLPEPVGAMQGVPYGAIFTGKSELMVLGLHGGYYKGISQPSKERLQRNPDLSHAAFAIVMNGGYEDDDDTNGPTFTYQGASYQRSWRSPRPAARPYSPTAHQCTDVALPSVLARSC